MKPLENEITEELTGIHGLNFAFPNSSSARSVMFASHFSQRLVVEKPDNKIIQTGLEYEMSKYTFDIRMPVNGNIIKVIYRYPKTVDVDCINFSPERVIIYEDNDTKEIGAFSLPYYQSYHQYFGFKNIIRQENVSRLVPGNFIEKDTIFASSNAVDPNGGYKYGVSLNMAFMSHPSVSEDGIMISESALKKLEFSVFETRVVEFGGNMMPLNIYGDINNYKAFPEIGETIKDNGILMSLRKIDIENYPVDMNIYDTMEIDYIFDTSYYVRGPGGRIVDMVIYKDDTVSNSLPDEISNGMYKYIKGYRTFYQELLDTEKEIRQNRMKKYGVDNTVLSPYLHRLLVEGLAVLDTHQKKHGGKKLNLIYRKATLPEFRIVFKIEYKIRPRIGFKLSDSQGGKGVICRIEKDKNMPVDKDGNIAEIVMDSGSTISRMNLSRLYEQYISAASRDVRKKIIYLLNHNFYESHDKAFKYLSNLSPQLLEQARYLLVDFLSIINTVQGEFIRGLTLHELIEYLTDVVSDKLYILYSLNNPKEITDIVKEIEIKYPPCYSPVNYVGISGNQVTTERNVRIGPLYMMLLEKIADDWSAVSYGKMSHFGVLSQMTKSEKYITPFRNNPVRALGETEARIISSYCDKYVVAEMMDRSNNPNTQKNLTWNILDSKYPSNIDMVVDRELLGYGGYKTLSIINHIFACAGFKLKYTPEVL